MQRNFTIIILTLLIISCGSDDDNTQQPDGSLYTVSTLVRNLNGSGDLAVDDNGNIYVADFGNKLNNADGTIVTKITPDGQQSVFATGLSGASGNEFDAEGNLIQSNIKGNTLSRISPDGTVETIVSTNLSSPVGVAIDDQGNIFVCNCAGGSITKVTPDGETSIFSNSTLFSCPNGLTIDQQNNLYAANFNNGNVIKVSTSGEASLFATLPGGSNGHIAYNNGSLYVVARGPNQIYKLSLDGNFTLIAGNSTKGKTDGFSLQAEFSDPNGIAFSPDGKKIYINDKVSTTAIDLNPVDLRVLDLLE